LHEVVTTLGVLITRPGEAAVETARRVAALGLRPVLAPALAIVPRPASLPDPARLQAVLVTSGHALPALPDTFHALPLLAVGDGTAARARQAGFARVSSARGDAEALARLVLEACRPAGQPLLLASGEGQGKALAAWLRARGFRVLRRTTHAARPAPGLAEAAGAAFAAGDLGAALFFSPATARAFVAAVRHLPPERIAVVEALAISPATAAALSPLPWRRIRVASLPTQEELLALLP
jgi:uroporphyrinogen-III synthase